MNRCWLAVACVLIGSLAAVAEEKPVRPPPGAPVAVYVELSQVEVNVTKLRRMGIDWKILSENAEAAGNPAWLRKLAELMVENNLARMVASPRLTTVAGREAVFDVATTRATLLPRVVDGKIAVEVTLETFDPPVNERGEIDGGTRGEPERSLSTKVACRPGQTVLLGQEAATSRNSKGEVTAETMTLTLLLADTKMPEVQEARKRRVPELRPVARELRPAERPAERPIVGERPLGSAVENEARPAPRRR